MNGVALIALEVSLRDYLALATIDRGQAQACAAAGVRNSVQGLR
jgi:hypothetical protein